MHSPVMIWPLFLREPVHSPPASMQVKISVAAAHCPPAVVQAVEEAYPVQVPALASQSTALVYAGLLQVPTLQKPATLQEETVGSVQVALAPSQATLLPNVLSLQGPSHLPTPDPGAGSGPASHTAFVENRESEQ
jgi:hypothetical protein